MIFGNPYKFAIQFDIVPDWVSDGFLEEGVISFYIKGKRTCHDMVRRDSLWIHLNSLHKSVKFAQNQKPLPQEISGLQDAEIYTKLHDARFITIDLGVEECYDYQIAPYAVTDLGYALFFIKGIEFDRLLMGNLNGKQLLEVVNLPVNYVEDVVNQACAALDAAVTSYKPILTST